MAWSKMVDLELSDDDKLDTMMPLDVVAANKPAYPWGLKICLTEVELEKLGLDCSCEVGDVIDLRAFAVVTGVHTEKREERDSARVELQIERLAIEDEAKEDTSEGED